jgi:malic enzyme
MPVRERGRELLGNRLLNKDTAFTERERDALGIRGLLPATVTTIEEQVALELEHVRRKSDELERYIGLAALQDRNETLFYRLLTENLEEFVPIVYTPIVGRACQQFSHILRRPRGVWLTPDDVGRMDRILRDAAGAQDVRLIVVTDNERILGLGDQGAGGMPIPVGKLALYTAAAGLYPAWTLPVSLDVGTDREELLADPLYLGYRSPRLRGDAYDEVLEAFVEAVKDVFPQAVLQWEDFKQHNALRVLERYRHRLTCFNDDIQGTGAVVLGGLLAARGRKGLSNDRFLFIGAGAAGSGISRIVARQLMSEGLCGDDVRAHIALINRGGLVHTGRSDLAADQLGDAVDPQFYYDAGLTDADLADPLKVARALKPTVLIGTTGQRGAFTEELIREVARHSDHPIILPLSNPDSNAEARAEDVIEWTDGRAIVATGSPSRDVEWGGVRRTIGQANNVFIFPGVGLGAVVAQARELADDAFLVAARTLADLVPDDRLARGAIYPPISALREVARTIAEALVVHLRDSGYGRQLRDDQISRAVDRAIWRPEYLPYHPA